jgi:hypothetical protein
MKAQVAGLVTAVTKVFEGDQAKVLKIKEGYTPRVLPA